MWMAITSGIPSSNGKNVAWFERGSNGVRLGERKIHPVE